MRTQTLKAENTINALHMIDRFGWARGDTLGRLIWPETASAPRMGQRLAASLSSQKLTLARTLPNRAGTAYVVADKGGRLLRSAGLEPLGSGKDWGKFDNEKWSPPASWQHDLWTQELVAWLGKSSTVTSFLTDRELRARIDWQSFRMGKIPDALVEIDGIVFWLEVERTRKSGDHQQRMINAAIAVMRGSADALCGLKPSQIIFATPSAIIDQKTGHHIDHRLRLKHALQRSIERDIAPHFLNFDLLGAAPVNVKFERVLVQSDSVSKRLATLERQIAGITPYDENGMLTWYLNHVEQFWATDRGRTHQYVNAEICKLEGGFQVAVTAVAPPPSIQQVEEIRTNLCRPFETKTFAEAKRRLAGILDRWHTKQHELNQVREQKEADRHRRLP